MGLAIVWLLQDLLSDGQQWAFAFADKLEFGTFSGQVRSYNKVFKKKKNRSMLEIYQYKFITLLGM